MAYLTLRFCDFLLVQSTRSDRIDQVRARFGVSFFGERDEGENLRDFAALVGAQPVEIELG